MSSKKEPDIDLEKYQKFLDAISAIEKLEEKMEKVAEQLSEYWQKPDHKFNLAETHTLALLGHFEAYYLRYKVLAHRELNGMIIMHLISRIEVLEERLGIMDKSTPSLKELAAKVDDLAQNGINNPRVEYVMNGLEELLKAKGLNLGILMENDKQPPTAAQQPKKTTENAT